MPPQTRRTSAKVKPAPKAAPADAAPVPDPDPPPLDAPPGHPPLVDLDDPQLGQTLRGVLPACGYTSVGIGDRSFRVDPETDILVEETT